MCVAYPMQVTAVAGDHGKVALGDAVQEVSFELLDDVAVGDYVVVHAGFALQKLAEEEAAETLSLLRQIAAGPEDRT